MVFLLGGSSSSNTVTLTSLQAHQMWRHLTLGVMAARRQAGSLGKLYVLWFQGSKENKRIFSLKLVSPIQKAPFWAFSWRPTSLVLLSQESLWRHTHWEWLQAQQNAYGRNVRSWVCTDWKVHAQSGREMYRAAAINICHTYMGLLL